MILLLTAYLFKKFHQKFRQSKAANALQKPQFAMALQPVANQIDPVTLKNISY